VELSRLDLNLLVALDALLQQRSVSKAAAQTGVGQPAMSSSLARLRRHFGDDLLTRVGNEYRLTPLALELRDRARMALAGFERVFGARDDFDPSTTSRQFVLQVSDYGEAVLGSAVAGVLAQEAPGARMQLVPNTPRPLDSSDPALLGTDLVIMPHGFLTDLPYEDLFSDEWVCVVASSNTAVGDALTHDHLRTLPWVVTFHSTAGTTQGMANLRLAGIEPSVQLVTEHFLTVPGHIAGSDRVALLQRRLVGVMPARDDVRVLPCPFVSGSLSMAMWWHPVHDDDPAHAWLRTVVRRAARLATRDDD
jgi:DNA-binding transcriptional LysR family regulator